jgi:hypothetical protein
MWFLQEPTFPPTIGPKGDPSGRCTFILPVCLSLIHEMLDKSRADVVC